MTEEQKKRYKETLKHSDTEEHIDLWFYRPLGFRLALIGEMFGWSPNAITVVGLLLGACTGLLCYPDNWMLNLLGMLLLVIADICDSADGQLARMTGKFSRIGRILDGACGDVWFISIYVCICLRLMPEWSYWIWILAATSGYCHRMQAAMADYYRNFHLYMVNGKKGSELDDSIALTEQYKQISWWNLLRKIAMWVYIGYTRTQESLTPQMQQLRVSMHAKYADGQIDAQVSSEFRKLSFPLLKYTNILSFNWRAITLFISLMLGQPWLYFVVELTVFNAMLFYMHSRYEKIAKQLC